jgi:tetratricopeptide (TPR) repeat protein/2-polyprenyl-3-methyl-5-hydroxy-6-metoxy-1,4-benzoquinol methylase
MPAAAGTGVGASARIAELMATALRHHQAGQLAEAERHYRAILAIDQNHADSLHLLGVIGLQLGRNEMAVDLIRKAIALDDRKPAFHNNIGLAFDALGRTEDAVLHYRRAVTLNPSYVEAHANLGAALLAQGKLDEAVARYQRALALKPDFAEAHNNLGNALKEQGKLDEAVTRYQRALTLKPAFAEAHNNLGNALKRQGKLDEAVTRYQRALALKPGYVEAHHNLANALKEQGKLDEAAACYRQALVLRPGYVEAHYNLGNALHKQGKLDEASAEYRQALALKPNFAEAHYSLGTALQEQGKLDEAVTQYQRALALAPDLAEAHNSLGTAFQDQGKLTEATAHYRRALALDPQHAETHGNLGRALMQAGDFAQALEAIQRGIDLAETDDIKLLFVRCVGSLPAAPAGVDLRPSLIRALSEPWGRPTYLANFVTRLLSAGGATRACIDRVSAAWPRHLSAQELFGPTELAEICIDRLFRCLLESTPVCDIALERFLTATRFAMLELACRGGFETSPYTLGVASAGSESHQVEDDALQFFCAVAQQCFINEYVFAHSDGEIDEARRLRALLVEALASGTSVPELWLVTVAAYFPLADLPGADSILSRPWSAASVAALVTRQVQERQEEQQLQSSVSRLTVIADGVSRQVRQQYEESPYPRWRKASPVGRTMTVDEYLRRRFPLAPLADLTSTKPVEILVAGCGTGQHSIETARQFPGAQVLAIDLSLSSLGYAKRKTRELGLSNIDYAQADILQLPSIGRAFDVIEVSGVLHHLADPMAAWRLLLSMLRPGGFMRVGLYSRTARRDVVDARRFIARSGYRPSADDIRRCRQEITSLADGTSIRRIAEWSDFFTTSACRDLLFHVQEHQMTLPEIKAFLSENGLQFLGFDAAGYILEQYRRRFPDDRAMLDLDYWHTFETENTLVFAGMYQFWIQKTC